MINYHILNDSIVLNFKGKTEVLSSSDSRYEKVIDCIRQDRLDDIPKIVDLVQDLINKGLDVKDGLILINGEAMPESLSKRILAFQAQDLPFKYLLNFWDNLKKNPSFNSKKMLFKFLEFNGHPITKDGCFIAYRGVTDEFKDVHTRKFDNSPGSICEMDRSNVDDNPDNTCSNGLHVACFDYANGFGSKTIEVKVNPKDVVAVPKDYNGTKMRVCKFEVIQECENIREEELYVDDNLDDNDDCTTCEQHIDNCICGNFGYTW